VFLTEGLELRIINRDIIHLKYVKEQSRFIRESEAFECELEEEVEIE
jgi:hypothetical protein